MTARKNTRQNQSDWQPFKVIEEHADKVKLEQIPLSKACHRELLRVNLRSHHLKVTKEESSDKIR